MFATLENEVSFEKELEDLSRKQCLTTWSWSRTFYHLQYYSLLSWWSLIEKITITGLAYVTLGPRDTHAIHREVPSHIFMQERHRLLLLNYVKKYSRIVKSNQEFKNSINSSRIRVQEVWMWIGTCLYSFINQWILFAKEWEMFGLMFWCTSIGQVERVCAIFCLLCWDKRLLFCCSSCLWMK